MNRLITVFLLLLGRISSFLSIKARTRYGSFIGFFLKVLSSKRKEITLNNISNAFPDNSQTDNYNILKESYANLGITLAELLAFPYMKEKDFEKYIKYENIELIREHYDRGKGVILISGHFGNWELVAYTAGLFTELPVLIIVKPQKNEHADKILNSYRTSAGNKVVPMNKAARDIVRTIRSGSMIALLADQSATKDRDIFVDFFGRPASTYEAPAELALKYDVPMIAGFAVRQQDGTYKVKLEEIKHDDLAHDKEGIRILTERHVKILENAIRKNPGHWSWQHRRWKYLGEGTGTN